MTRRYIYADESGNFDFSNHQGATRYYGVGSIAIDTDKYRASMETDMHNLTYTLANQGLDVDGWFHATTDRQAVRDAVYQLLTNVGVGVDVTYVEKRKVHPKLRATDADFYRKMWELHFNALSWQLDGIDELVVVGASLGTKKKKTEFRKAIQDVVAQKCPPHIAHKVWAWKSESSPGLQVADYMLWAVMRDVEHGDKRSRTIIQGQIRTCFHAFKGGHTDHY